MRCYYHTNLDGRCSAAIILREFPHCELHPINCSTHINWSRIKDDRVIMVDYSLPIKEMELFDPKKFIWIDHHETYIDDARERNFLPLGIRSKDTASCELTWTYFNTNYEMPLGVKFISKYDTWELDWLKDKYRIEGISGVILFQYGLKVYNTDPESNIWSEILTGDMGFIEETMETGYNILQYTDDEHGKYSTSFSFETEFEGLNCICCNRGYVDSRFFSKVYDEKRHSIMIAFARQGRKRRWKVSLYTTHESINCGEIAKRYGGGGHRRAAGFKCKNLPFKI